MWMKKSKSAEPRREYDREIFRSSVVSLFSNLIAIRRKQVGFTFTALAEKLGINKSAPSRWFAGDKPNWEANTMADIANALGVELEIYARDIKTGQRFAPYGPIVPTTAIVTSSSDGTPVRRNPLGYQEAKSQAGYKFNGMNNMLIEVAA